MSGTSRPRTAVRPVALSDSVELDTIISEYTQSSGETVGKYILIGQTAFLQFLGTVVILLGVILYVYALFIDIKNKQFKSW